MSISPEHTERGRGDEELEGEEWEVGRRRGMSRGRGGEEERRGGGGGEEERRRSLSPCFQTHAHAHAHLGSYPTH